MNPNFPGCGSLSVDSNAAISLAPALPDCTTQAASQPHVAIGRHYGATRHHNLYSQLITCQLKSNQILFKGLTPVFDRTIRPLCVQNGSRQRSRQAHHLREPRAPRQPHPFALRKVLESGLGNRHRRRMLNSQRVSCFFPIFYSFVN